MNISVESYNSTFPRYPKLVEDKGWVYGVWYCGAFYKSKLYGDYPPTFLKRARSLFPDIDESRLLHCPSGSLNEVGGVTVDLVRDEKRHPQIIASADNLPFADNSFDLVLSDPPYRRVLSPRGYLGLLHFYYPTFRRADWDMVALIGVCTGSNRKMRMFAIFQNTK